MRTRARTSHRRRAHLRPDPRLPRRRSQRTRSGVTLVVDASCVTVALQGADSSLGDWVVESCRDHDLFAPQLMPVRRTDLGTPPWGDAVRRVVRRPRRSTRRNTGHARPPPGPGERSDVRVPHAAHLTLPTAAPAIERQPSSTTRQRSAQAADHLFREAQDRFGRRRVAEVHHEMVDAGGTPLPDEIQELG